MSGFPNLPAPPLLLDHLLALVFIVHVLFMNYVIAAPFIASWYLLIQGGKGAQRAKWITAPLPVAFTFTVTFGVAPLLFMQTLYGKFFYTANIMLGGRWLAVVFVIIAAFYLSYIVNHRLAKSGSSPTLSGLLILLTGLLVWSVGFIMTWNYFLSVSTGQWPALLENPLKVAASASFPPRILHMLVGSFAVAGLWMVMIAKWHGKREGDSEELGKLSSQGVLISASATLMQIIIGIWYLLRLPAGAWDKLFSGSIPGIVWMIGVAGGLLLLGILITAAIYPKRPNLTNFAVGLLAVTLIGMVAGRGVVRLHDLGREFSLRTLPYTVQTGPMLIFFVLLVIALLLVIYMLRLIWRK